MPTQKKEGTHNTHHRQMDEIQAASKQEHGCRCMYENRSIKNQKGTIIAVKLKIAKRAVFVTQKISRKK